MVPATPWRPGRVVTSPDRLSDGGVTGVPDSVGQLAEMPLVTVACPAPAITDCGKTLGSHLADRDTRVFRCGKRLVGVLSRHHEAHSVLVADPVLSDGSGHRDFCTVTIGGLVPAEDVTGKQAEPAVAGPLEWPLHECLGHKIGLITAKFDLINPFLDTIGRTLVSHVASLVSLRTVCRSRHRCWRSGQRRTCGKSPQFSQDVSTVPTCSLPL